LPPSGRALEASTTTFGSKWANAPSLRCGRRRTSAARSPRSPPASPTPAARRF
jgi:hypothetical protein